MQEAGNREYGVLVQKQLQKKLESVGVCLWGSQCAVEQQRYNLSACVLAAAGLLSTIVSMEAFSRASLCSNGASVHASQC